jgi:hypothetical protein
VQFSVRNARKQTIQQSIIITEKSSNNSYNALVIDWIITAISLHLDKQFVMGLIFYRLFQFFTSPSINKFSDKAIVKF